MEERRYILRRIKKAERRIAAGYVPPKGQESEPDKLARLQALVLTKESHEQKTHSEAQV
jgi:bifunctional DNA-binding transcriptional regulator/antitoxin component of YhaV-PrlF toxin-antitoxin module